MIENELLGMISQLGFPIVVACWFMFRTEKVIDRNTKAFNKMTDMYDLYRLNGGKN